MNSERWVGPITPHQLFVASSFNQHLFAMDVFRHAGISVTSNRPIKRCAIFEGNAFVSATLGTFNILQRLMTMKVKMAVVIKQETSNLDMLCSSEHLAYF